MPSAWADEGYCICMLSACALHCLSWLRSSAVSVAVSHWDQTEVTSFCLVHQTAADGWALQKLLTRVMVRLMAGI